MPPPCPHTVGARHVCRRSAFLVKSLWCRWLQRGLRLPDGRVVERGQLRPHTAFERFCLHSVPKSWCHWRVGFPSGHAVQALDVSNKELSEMPKHNGKGQLRWRGEQSNGPLPDVAAEHRPVTQPLGLVPPFAVGGHFSPQRASLTDKRNRTQGVSLRLLRMFVPRIQAVTMVTTPGPTQRVIMRTQ